MKVFLLTVFISVASLVKAQQHQNYTFAPDFMFGTATAAFQVEGGWNADGKGPSIWDTYIHTHPTYTSDRNNADVACDSYHLYKRDVEMLKELGVNHYRFSISWPRILPTGKIDKINEAGVQYYNNLLDELIKANITPLVTMYHWDLPQGLSDEAGVGWTDKRIVNYYVDYARVLFTRFGDKVKHWLTFNEVYQFCGNGYGTGGGAPGIRASGVKDYQCTHNVLLAHGYTYRMYQKEFKAQQGGKIGMAIDSDWHEPASNSADDVAASEFIMQMNYGWVVHPVFLGDYPPQMIDRIRNVSLNVQHLNASRLPQFTREEIDVVKGAYDFMGLNHYATNRCRWSKRAPTRTPSREDDIGVDCSWDNAPEGTPWGLNRILMWIKSHYNNPPILITENGHDGETTVDPHRINYIRGMLYELSRAVHEGGCNVIGYTYWCLMDDFEWGGGLSIPMGLYHVDFRDPAKKRSPKQSASVYSHIIKHRYIDWNFKPTNLLSEQ